MINISSLLAWEQQHHVLYLGLEHVMKDTLPASGLDCTRSSSLPLRHSDEHLTCFAQTQRERETGHLVGRMDGEGDGAGGRARRRSGRQLLGHCLPGVCASVISQPLSSLASYDTHTHTHLNPHAHTNALKPTRHRSRPCASLPLLPLSASSMLRLSGAGQIH